MSSPEAAWLRRAGLVAYLGLCSISPLPAQTPQFVEISDQAGVGDMGFSYSHAWGDYNGDGLVDLFVSFVGRAHILYRNAGGGVFENASLSAGILADENPAGEGVVWADSDNDGDLDLFVTNGCVPNPTSPNVWYRNNGGGTFTRATQEAGLHYIGPTQGTAWADYDLDGFIDLYVGLLKTANPNPGNFLYRNNHGGTFTNVAATAGVNDQRDSNGGAAWADYDNDGDPDLYVANRNEPNALFRNNRDGTFTDVAAGAGVNGADNSEGVAWGDYDNDGWLDLFVASLDAGESKLYRNNRNGTFTNVTTPAHMNLPGSSVGSNWADFDNDGWLDLLVVNASNTAPNRLYRNNGDGTFTDVAAMVGLAQQENGRVGAWADINNDGFLDLFVSNYGKNRLFRNMGNGNHWLVVRPAGVSANRDSIGVRVEATTVINGQVVRQTRELSAGGSRHSQDSLPLEFGLGDASYVDLVLTFPGGTLQHWGRVAANQSVVFREGNKPPFSDDDLTAGSSVIRAVHITELRTRIEALHARYGLEPYPYTDPAITSGSTLIKAAHITDLRNALKEAYTAAMLTELTYTDSNLLSGATVKAAHLAELRAGVIAIE